MRSLKRWQQAYLGFLLLLIGVAAAFDAARPALPWLLLAFGGALIVYRFYERRLFAPLRNLVSVLHRLNRGEREARILSTTQDEVGQIIRAFNQRLEQDRQYIETLGKSQQRLVAVFRQALDGVVITNQKGDVVSINPAAAQMLERQAGRSLQRSLAEVVQHHEIIELWRRSQISDKVEASVIEIGRTGQFWQVEISPIDAPEVTGRLIILHDLTPLRRLETIRRDFVSNISHELRTPLASLRAVIETLQDGALDDPEAAERFLFRAEGEIDTLTQMVEELLELSRIESGRVPFIISDTDTHALLEHAAERIHSQAQRKQIALAVHTPQPLPAVQADAGRIQQVLGNLLYNAVKFTPQGGAIELSATEIVENDTRYVRIAVADNGIGIAPEDLPRIFERFYKVDRARTRSGGGTGLGLAIAKHIVQSHGGRIWAESRPRAGSKFFFTLPAAEGNPPHQSKTAVNKTVTPA